jgi:hypothetical protein
MSGCSIGHLPRLEVLDLYECENLQRLPSSLGHLIAMQDLYLVRCRNLEGVLDTIIALSSLQIFFMGRLLIYIKFNATNNNGAFVWP